VVEQGEAFFLLGGAAPDAMSLRGNVPYPGFEKYAPWLWWAVARAAWSYD
jgi:hypothetical protein